MLLYKYLLGLSGIFAMANGHMLLNQPMRFPSQDVPDNGPLSTTLSGATNNYPCKLTSVSTTYAFDFPRTQLPLGSNQSLHFEGSAVHGGGSCQVSLTKDLEPTTDSVFKVIHTIEGGCPARNTPGNLEPESADVTDPFTYAYTVPAGLEPGQYTFAWTWFNKVGNREMYMNCAPVEVTGSSKRRALDTRGQSFFDSLPDMFVANIPVAPDCASPAEGSGNLKFPNPGNSIDLITPDELSPPLITGNANCYAPIKAAGGLTNAGVNPSASPGSASASSSLPPASPSATPAATPTTASPSSMPSSPTYPLTNATSVGPPIASNAAGACASGSVACSNPGGVVCIGATQFGLCNTDNCAIAQALAGGTSCSAGTITRRHLHIPPQARARALLYGLL